MYRKLATSYLSAAAFYCPGLLSSVRLMHNKLCSQCLCRSLNVFSVNKKCAHKASMNNVLQKRTRNCVLPWHTITTLLSPVFCRGVEIKVGVKCRKKKKKKKKKLPPIIRHELNMVVWPHFSTSYIVSCHSMVTKTWLWFLRWLNRQEVSSKRIFDFHWSIYLLVPEHSRNMVRCHLHWLGLLTVCCSQTNNHLHLCIIFLLVEICTHWESDVFFKNKMSLDSFFHAEWRRLSPGILVAWVDDFSNLIWFCFFVWLFPFFIQWDSSQSSRKRNLRTILR